MISRQHFNYHLIKFVAICLWLALISCVPDKSKELNSGAADSTAGVLQKSEPAIIVPVYYPFKITIQEKSNWNLKIDSIESSAFDERKEIQYAESKIDGDSLIKSFSHRFEDVITLTDSCCVFKGRDQDFQACFKRSGDMKTHTSYEGFGYDHGYLIIIEWGYEMWSYSCFNPVIRKHFYSANEPRFISDALVYAAGNYYAEGQFEIRDLAADKYYAFDTFNWELTGFYQQDNSIFMRFRNHGDNKFIKVTF